MSEKTNIRIKQLDLDTIQPSTFTYRDPKQGGSKIVVIGKPGCFRFDTPVRMYDGTIKPVQDVNPGDRVMGDDGTPRTVLELCRGKEQMWDITRIHGDTVTVNVNHILSLTHEESGEIWEPTVKEYLTVTDEHADGWLWYRKPTKGWSSKLTELQQYIAENADVMLWKPAGISCRLANRVCDEYMPVLTVYAPRESDHYRYLQDAAERLGMVFVHREDTIHVYSPLLLYESGSGKPPHVLEEFYLNPNMTVENYYGFTLTGNHRFLLEDGSVVHNTGKSTLIKSLLYHKRNIFPVASVFSGTEDTNGFYQKFIPDSFIYNEYDENKITSFIQRQKLATEHLENPWGVLLIDDCTDDPRVFHTPLQQGIYKRGRHWKMLSILSLQFCLDIKPVIRANTDGVFILRESNITIRKRLWKNYASIIPDFNDFCSILDQITDDYTALYINNQTQSNNIEDVVFWYKAPLPPDDFKFGAPEIWDFHDKRYNPDYVQRLI